MYENKYLHAYTNEPTYVLTIYVSIFYITVTSHIPILENVYVLID